MQSEIWKPLWVAIFYHVLREGETGRWDRHTQRDGDEGSGGPRGSKMGSYVLRFPMAFWV